MLGNYKKNKLQYSTLCIAHARNILCSVCYRWSCCWFHTVGPVVKARRKEVEYISNRTMTQAEQRDLAAETNRPCGYGESCHWLVQRQDDDDDDDDDMCRYVEHVLNSPQMRCPSQSNRYEMRDRKSYCKTRQLKKSIYIWEEINWMNRDRKSYNFPTTYDHLLVTCSSSSRDHMPDEVCRWRTKYRNGV